MAVRGIEPTLTRDYMFVRLHAPDLEHIVDTLRKDCEARGPEGSGGVTIKVEDRYVVDEVTDLRAISGGRVKRVTISCRAGVLILGPRASRLQMVTTDDEQSHVTFNRIDSVVSPSQERSFWSAPARDWLGFLAMMMLNSLLLSAVINSRPSSSNVIAALVLLEVACLTAAVVAFTTVTSNRRVVLMQPDENFLRRRAPELGVVVSAAALLLTWLLR
ncbi:hypothetical protein EUA93_12650 [Nocardioides oleivorans]|uniref:Uncharacterized protein n=1 Tax=Nocardioides oleivorans TaxID=273676 RepID=A0A4Q2S0X7_9ACTN|nr:hypothetical protein [Nocardioides oleivorans]RYB95118.1 hypothetical protein EUA93_12650 [Nocardioides oleivorans]